MTDARERQIEHLWNNRGGVRKGISLAREFKLAEKQRREDFRQVAAVNRRGTVSARKASVVADMLLIHIAKIGSTIREAQKISEHGDHGLALEELNRAGFDIGHMVCNLELMQRFLMEASGVEGYLEGGN